MSNLLTFLMRRDICGKIRYSKDKSNCDRVHDFDIIELMDM